MEFDKINKIAPEFLKKINLQRKYNLWGLIFCLFITLLVFIPLYKYTSIKILALLLLINIPQFIGYIRLAKIFHKIESYRYIFKKEYMEVYFDLPKAERCILKYNEIKYLTIRSSTIGAKDGIKDICFATEFNFPSRFTFFKINKNFIQKQNSEGNNTHIPNMGFISRNIAIPFLSIEEVEQIKNQILLQNTNIKIEEE